MRGIGWCFDIAHAGLGHVAGGGRIPKESMAAKCYILIETAVGNTRNVATAVKALAEVKSVDLVTGPYDIILVVEAQDLHSIGEFVIAKVHTLPGVNRTVTCMTV